MVNRRKELINPIITMDMINDLIHQNPMDEHVIIENVMDYVGFEVNEITQVVEDIDLFTPIAIQGKTLKYAKNNYVSIDFDTETFFNPLRNYSAAQAVFLHLLHKLEISGDFYSPIYDIEYDKEDNRLKRLVVFDEKYSKIMTEFYFNTNLMFIEMVYQLAGDDTTFKEIDEPY